MSRLRVLSLFCGLGGFDLGLYAAADELGIEVEVVAALDAWPVATDIYNANQRHPVARVADVKQMTRADLPPHDLIIGGPPCVGHSQAGKRLGRADPRDCLADFERLVGLGTSDESPYIMENVASRLIRAPWSERFCAADFGDVTSRKRWFYSNYLLHVVPTPGPLRVRDIKDRERDDPKRDRSLYMRSHGMTARAIPDDGFLGSLVATTWHGTTGAHPGTPCAPLIPMECGGYRCPSLLEMARAHSIPDSWDWCGATKTDQGKLIANSVPASMAKAVCKAMLERLR